GVPTDHRPVRMDAGLGCPRHSRPRYLVSGGFLRRFRAVLPDAFDRRSALALSQYDWPAPDRDGRAVELSLRAGRRTFYFRTGAESLGDQCRIDDVLGL